jgi:hypothetical protein
VAAAVRHTLPVLQWLPRAAQAAPSFSAPLCAMLCNATRDLEWRQTYSLAEVASGAIERGFLDRYGWCELIGPAAATVDGLTCGCLLLGPDTHYPSHSHEAEELYVPLSGTASWRQGEIRTDKPGWRELVPGTLIHHAAFEPHAMRTHGDPLLALYLWRGGNVRAKASFLPP